MNRLANRVALVTGGNTGIGRGVALTFATEGADVVVAYHGHEAEAHTVAREIEARGRRCLPVQVEVTREASVQAMADAVRKEFGRLDVFVNNAGVQKPQALEEMTVEDWDHMMAVHLRGAFLCCKALVPIMSAGGRIIITTSQLGYIGRGGYTAYCTAKGGLLTFTRSLARELAPQGILVNSVAPGLVDTGFDPLSDERKHAVAESMPMKRLATVEDVVGAYVFLASDEARFFCGQVLHPDGGDTMV